jgi:hypothetical protein
MLMWITCVEKKVALALLFTARTKRSEEKNARLEAEHKLTARNRNIRIRMSAASVRKSLHSYLILSSAVREIERETLKRETTRDASVIAWEKASPARH